MKTLLTTTLALVMCFDVTNGRVCKEQPQLWCAYAITIAGDYLLYGCFDKRKDAEEALS